MLRDSTHADPQWPEEIALETEQTHARRLERVLDMLDQKGLQKQGLFVPDTPLAPAPGRARLPPNQARWVNSASSPNQSIDIRL